MSGGMKAGIIGAGHYSRVHAKAYTEAGVRIVAVADIDPAAAEAFAGEFDVPHVFHDYRQLVALEDLDIVSVTLPVYLHAPATIAALAKGKHVLCEKPMAMNCAEARRIARAARKAGRHVAYGSSRPRYAPQARAARRMIEQGKLGTIYRAEGRHIRRRFRPGIEYQPDTVWWLDSAEAGGGILIDMAVYHLDLILGLLDWPRVKTVSAATFQGIPHRLPRGRKYDVEEDASVFMRCGDGLSITIQVAGASNIGYALEKKMFDEVVILGSHGGIRIDPFTCYSEKAGLPVEVTTTWLDGEGETTHIIEAMIRAIRRGGPAPHTTAEEGVRLMRLVDAMYRSARLGREVQLG